MTSHEILKADVLDILFENRNKQYGAYELRKQYNNRMGVALGIMFSGAMLVGYLFLTVSGKEGQHITPEIPDVVLSTVELFKEPELPEQPEPPARTPMDARQVATVDHGPIKIVSQDIMEVPEQSTIATAAVGSDNIEGNTPIDGRTPAPVTSQAGGGNAPVELEPQPNSFQPLEKGPEFPGGQEAWMNFLTRHLRTPDELEPGEKRTVLVKFYVGIDGSIANFEVVQSGGSSLDKEVIRVLKKMPKWKPAIQNGHPVTVMFTQPVTFMATEE